MPRLDVYCLEDERAIIEKKAAQAGMPLSMYMRTAAMGAPITSAEDKRHVATLARVKADAGRVGGLLKALLTNDERFDGSRGRELRESLKKAIEDNERLQNALRSLIMRLVKTDS